MRRKLPQLMRVKVFKDLTPSRAQSCIRVSYSSRERGEPVTENKNFGI